MREDLRAAGPLLRSGRRRAAAVVLAEGLHVDLGDERGARIQLGEAFGQSGDGLQAALGEQLGDGFEGSLRGHVANPDKVVFGKRSVIERVR